MADTNKIVLLDRLEQVKKYIDENDTSVGNTAAGLVSAEATRAQAAEAANAAAAKAAQDDVDALEGLVGTIPEGATATTVVAYAKEVADAASGNASQVASDLAAYKTSNNAAVAANKKAIEDEVNRATTKEGELETSISGVATDLATLDGELKAIAKSGAAADVSIADAESVITATTVEGALTELAKAVSASTTAGVVTCEKSSPSDVAARYVFKQGGIEIPNAVIDIPKDMVVESGEVITNPEGKPAGTYMVLTLANAAEDKLYINVTDLIEYVTGGETDEVAVAVNAEHVATATIKKIAATKIVYKAAEGEQAEVSVAAALNDIYNQIGEGGSVAAQIETAINKLDYATEATGDYVASITEVNGVIAPVYASFVYATDAEIKAMFQTQG